MYVGHDFTPAAPGESEIYTFDFVNDVQTGETLSTATWSISCAEDSAAIDDSAASRIISGAVCTGTRTSVRIAGLQPDVTYVVMAAAVTSAGNTIILHSHVTCQPVK